MGFPGEAAQTTFPLNIFLQGSDLSPLEEKLDKIIDGLTLWEPKAKGRSISKLPKIKVEGDDYEEAFAKMNNLFLRNLWSDGLPIQPATEQRVNWILTGTDLSRDTLVGRGKILPRGGLATVEMLAVCLAMAGGRPEYLPVLIAAIEAMTDPRVKHWLWNTTTGCCSPLVIVSGPVAKQIRVNRSYGCLGPSSEFPAGASIGRAIRFLLMNLGGAIPGKGTMSLHGGAGRYCGFVFAEDEDHLPPDWEPLSVDQGFPRGSNMVTFHVVGLTGQLWQGSAMTEKDALSTVKGWARTMADNAVWPTWAQWWHTAGAPGYLLVCFSAAQQLSNLGWSKENVRQYLYEHARCPESAELGKHGEKLGDLIGEMIKVHGLPTDFIQWPLPIARGVENIKLVVCGGDQGAHGYWLQTDQHGVSKTAKINLPANWDLLVSKNKEDLDTVSGDD
jgi:hypothetical protein